ncbi:hypothetical protein HK099_000667 [Clydaea vesicula]|uniref:BLOC-1-related complex subunit 6 C-terminal helix domain-containing protein n=1 Tax=Clydaea vesicula TaxID=447962 RepID=A0AAD5TUH7_9FUNG|nr:hypothetical protein HK099_000667 [Clydaea vesicula]
MELVLNYATPGGPPLGINIPNYDDIRMNLGFKNVSLGNVLNARAAGAKHTLIKPEDLEVYTKYMGESHEVQVGLHELLGHGSGKLLQETSEGQFNFDSKNPPKDPFTNLPVKCWYKPGETWGSATAATYEECRAEAVAMYLCVNREILSIFGHEATTADDVMYVCWLSMARAGLTSLEFYDPKSKKWGQAHMQARWAILNVFLNCGLCEVITDTDSVYISLKKELIMTKGVDAIGTFLKKLQLYKATGNGEEGCKFYDEMTSVPSKWFSVRDKVIKLKQPRNTFVQVKTSITSNGDIAVEEYEPTLEGLANSTTLTSIPLENTIPLDPTLVSDVELCAKEIEASINSLTTNLTNSLDEMTNSTKKFVQVQNLSVNNLNLEIDTSIEQTLSLINKVDELTHDMDTVNNLAYQM